MEADEAERTRASTLTLKTFAAVLLLLGGPLFGSALFAGTVRPDTDGTESLKIVAIVIGLPLFIAGLGLLAKAKGLHPAWGILGLGFIFGFVALWFIPNRCPKCDSRYACRRSECPFCATPP